MASINQQLVRLTQPFRALLVGNHERGFQLRFNFSLSFF